MPVRSGSGPGRLIQIRTQGCQASQQSESTIHILGVLGATHICRTIDFPCDVCLCGVRTPRPYQSIAQTITWPQGPTGEDCVIPHPGFACAPHVLTCLGASYVPDSGS